MAAARAADPSLDHDNPLAEVFEDQLAAADLVVLNKGDLVDDADGARAPRLAARAQARRARHRMPATGACPWTALLGLGAAAEDDLAARPSHHDAEDGAHEHDDFCSFVAELGEVTDADALVARIGETVRTHDILRVKGFCAVAGKNRMLAIEGVGPRIRREYGRVPPPRTRCGRDGSW